MDRWGMQWGTNKFPCGSQFIHNNNNNNNNNNKKEKKKGALCHISI